MNTATIHITACHDAGHETRRSKTGALKLAMIHELLTRKTRLA